VETIPSPPVTGETVHVRYDPAGRYLDGATAMFIHRGMNGWQDVTEDPMIWEPVTATWLATFDLSPDAGTLEFVFTDGGENWDNNAGADWRVRTHRTGSGYVMDGVPDTGVPLLADGNGLSLWGRRDGDLLYLATDGSGTTWLADHFLMVFSDVGGSRPALWGKSGSSPVWDWFLGTENDNGWLGWFDAGQGVVSGPAFAMAHGSALEGTLDLAALYGAPPADLWVAAVGYETWDGGALVRQSPAGDGDWDLDAGECFALSVAALTTGVAAPVPSGAPSVALGPNPFNPALAVRLTLPGAAALRVDVFDVTGRRVTVLHDGPAEAGEAVLLWDGRDAGGRECASGVYFVRAAAAGAAVTARAVLAR
jgi:hypothetical protein